MIIVGAGGHAKEILGVLYSKGQTSSVFLYDDITEGLPPKLFDQFTILRNAADAKNQLQKDPAFILGVGNPFCRFQLAQTFLDLGGVLTSIISSNASIGSFNVQLGTGLNIMPYSIITEDVRIGKGTLVHFQACIHHDCVVGNYCELLPGSRLLGKVVVGDYCSIGSGAVVLPRVRIGNRVVVGAGAVVTKDIPDGATVKGVPAK